MSGGQRIRRKILEPERGIWIYDNERRELIPKDEYVRPSPKRSSLPSPGIIGDTMDPVENQLDGKLYDSKSELRKTYRRAGVLEVGNDPQRLKPFKRKPHDRKAVRTSIEKTRARVDNGERTEAYRRKNP